MILTKKNLVVACLLAGASFAAAAQASSPVGVWKTVDDATKKEKSLIRITESGGVFTGKLEKLLDPTAKADAVCDKCSDERKDKPLVGMTIIQRVKHSADDPERWDGGEILDPNNGKSYKVRLTPADGGKRLDVRGYIGAPLLGRTQTWIRVE